MKQQFENGVHHITNDEYHDSQGISRSALWTFNRTPALYWHQYINPDYVKPEQTAPLILGNLVHCIALEPLEFDKQYAVAPQLDKRTKAGKQEWANFQLEADGKTIITHDMAIQADKMADRLAMNDTFRAMITDAKIEQSIYFTHERTGLQCKVRPDIWTGNIVGDLKTTDNASPREFQASAFKYGYYLQAGMISEALRSLGDKMSNFVFAAVEKKEPHLEALYPLDQDALDYGINLFNKLMDDFAECLLKDEWPGYGIQSLTIPSYAKIED